MIVALITAKGGIEQASRKKSFGNWRKTPSRSLFGREKDVSYKEGICPVVERLWRNELLTTDICKHPNTEREVEEFVRAVEKVSSNINQLLTMK